jgi:hypothetical protein
MTTYKCEICKKAYKQKHNYSRHVSVCNYLTEIHKEKELDTNDRVPNNNTLFELIKHLSIRVDNLENENKLLKRHRRVSSKSAIEMLNEQEEQPYVNFEKWIINDIYPLINDYYQDTFRTNIADAICNLLNHYFEIHSDKCLPIHTTSVKIQQFYMYEIRSQYESDYTWKKLTNENINNYIEHICNQFVVIFNEMWYKPNEALIAKTEKYKDIYFEHYKKILGGNISQDVRNKQIRKCLFDNLKKYNNF